MKRSISVSSSPASDSYRLLDSILSYHEHPFSFSSSIFCQSSVLNRSFTVRTPAVRSQLPNHKGPQIGLANCGGETRPRFLDQIFTKDWFLTILIFRGLLIPNVSNHPESIHKEPGRSRSLNKCPSSGRPACDRDVDGFVARRSHLELRRRSNRNHHYVHQFQQFLCRDRSSERIWRILQYLVLGEY